MTDTSSGLTPAQPSQRPTHLPAFPTHTHTLKTPSARKLFFPFPSVVYWKGNFDHEARTHTPRKYSFSRSDLSTYELRSVIVRNAQLQQLLDAEEETFLADSSGCFPHVRTLMQSYCNSLKPETTKTAAFPVALWESILLCRLSGDNRYEVPFYGYMNSPEQSPGRGMGRDTRL